MLKHGHTKNRTRSKTFRAWASMRDRCLCETSTAFEYYGGRGIKICARWEVFANFLEDMGNPPQGMTIDRINVHGMYCKENCRWISKTHQSYNRRGKKNGTSKFKGVVKRDNKYRARIRFKGKLHNLGTFCDENEAALAYDDAASRYFGEFAFFNFSATPFKRMEESCKD